MCDFVFIFSFSLRRAKKRELCKTQNSGRANFFGSNGVCVLRAFVSSILAAVPLIKARRGLHSALYLEDYTCSVYFSVQLEPTGVTQEGVNTGAFFFSLCVCYAPLLRCLPSLFIARRVRLSLSLVNTKVEFCPLTKLFSYISLSTTRYESEKKTLSPRFAT